ncbi:MAG: ribosome recycling factor [Clostridia bacterium]|nr:ribosome recycling factor [Clostridia bacterium]
MKEELKQFDEKMAKSINFYSTDINSLRAGRANPSILDKVQVEYYGSLSPLNQVGTISVPEPHMIVIQPWDKTILGEIERAINKSDIGIAPQNDGTVIRLNFPPLTEERRKEIVKTLHKKTEDAKVSIRSIRRDAMDFFKKAQKNGDYTEDDLKGIETEIQKLTDAKIKEIDGICALKEKEIMSI